MLQRFEKESEQIKRLNDHHEQELAKQLAAEKKLLPKRIKNEMKTRELMYRESIRISGSVSSDQEREKVRLVRVLYSLLFSTKFYAMRHVASLQPDKYFFSLAVDDYNVQFLPPFIDRLSDCPV